MDILITGASRGIGYSLAEYFASLGSHRLFLLSRNAEKLGCLKERLEKKKKAVKVIPLVFDLEKIREGGEVLKSTIMEHTQHIDILVNNAGFLERKAFEQVSGEDIDRALAVNFSGPALLIRLLQDLMGGKCSSHIVNISSMGGFQGSKKFPGLAVYSASKAALAVLTECLAEEWADRNIFVNCLALGAVQTEMLGEAFPGYTALVEAGSMASFIGDFALNGSRYFNGKILPVSLSTP